VSNPVTLVDSPDCQKNWEAIDRRGFNTGDLKMGAYTTPDPGWLLCNGAAVSRIGYPALFSKIGTSYGVGDGSTTFNLPNATGRAPVGAGTGSGLTARTLGDSFGAESVLLTAAQSGLRDHQHTHTVPSAVASGSSPNTINAGALGNANTSGVIGGLANSNAQSSHENMPPSFVVNYFIKV
jgi:microcystin-dependent protein